MRKKILLPDCFVYSDQVVWVEKLCFYLIEKEYSICLHLSNGEKIKKTFGSEEERNKIFNELLKEEN